MDTIEEDARAVRWKRRRRWTSRLRSHLCAARRRGDRTNAPGRISRYEPRFAEFLRQLVPTRSPSASALDSFARIVQDFDTVERLFGWR